MTGGVAMFLAFGIGVWVTGVLDDRFWPIMIGAALLVVIGLFDDRHNLDFRIRFVGQGIAAGVLVIGAGVRVDSLGNLLGFGVIDLGFLAIPFSIFAVVGMVNAINMLDGLDGLAGSITLVILGGIITLGVAADSGVVMPALILAAAVLGFLALNFRFPWRPRARVFMGDAGSNFLGYCLAWFVIALPQHASETVAPVHVLWLVGFPVADTLATMWRRGRQGLSPFHAGHDHAHHWLRKAGVGVRMTVLILVLTSFAYTLTGVSGALYSSLPESVLTYLFAVILALMAMLLPRIGLLPWLFQRDAGKKHAESSNDA
ncbi:MAG: MraY family glycosyltransferase [Thiohalocapsa sp.]